MLAITMEPNMYPAKAITSTASDLANPMATGFQPVKLNDRPRYSMLCRRNLSPSQTRNSIAMFAATKTSCLANRSSPTKARPIPMTAAAALNTRTISRKPASFWFCRLSPTRLPGSDAVLFIFTKCSFMRVQCKSR